MSSLLISIDRTALSLSPLLLSGRRGEQDLAVINYTEPAMRHRIYWAPESAYTHGSVALGAALEHALLPFDVTTDDMPTEAASRAAIAELRVALNQWAYDVTVTVNGVTETWHCNPGSIGASDRTYANMHNFQNLYPVSIPCYPVRS